MRRSILALCAVGLLLAGCGKDRSAAPSGGTSPDGGSIAGSVNDGSANDGVPQSLQFTAPLVGGGTVDFTQFRGHTVALWFWAPT